MFAGSALRKFVAPASLREIGQSAFRRCRQLAHVELNEGLQVLGAGCFAESGVSSIHIPESVLEIGEEAFSGCVHLASVKFAEHSALQFIGAGAFAGTEVREFHTPCRVQELGDGAFFDCKQLSVLELTPELSRVGALCFAGCCGSSCLTCLKDVKLPDGLVIIGERWFAGSEVERV